MAMYLVSQIDYHIWIRAAVPGYLLSLLLSTAVLFVGQEYNGSKRWLALGPLSFQPSEFAKTGCSSIAGGDRQPSGVAYEILEIYVSGDPGGAAHCRTGGDQ